MKTRDALLRGEVTDVLPNAQVRISVGGGSYRAYISGKMKQSRIRVVIGDRVEFVMPNVGECGRVIKRL